MKRTLKIITLIPTSLIIVGVLFFGASNVVHATDTLEYSNHQPADSKLINNASNHAIGQTGIALWTNGNFTASSNFPVNFVRIATACKSSQWGTSADIKIYLYRTSDSVIMGSGTVTKTCISDGDMASNTWISTTDDFVFASQATLSNGVQYGIAMGNASGVDETKDLAYAANAGTYSVYDLYSSVTPPSAQLYFPGPSTASSSLPLFSNWIVKLSNFSWSFQGQVSVAYSTATSSLWNTIALNPSYIDSNVYGAFATSTYIPLGNNLYDVSLTIPSTWYAQAQYCDGSGNCYRSTTNKFTFNPKGTIPNFDGATTTNPIYGGYGTNPQQMTTTSTIVDCSAYSFGFFSSTTVEAVACQFKKTTGELFSWLFSPSPTSWNNLTQSITNFRKIEPFNTIYSFRDSVNSNLVTSTPNDLVIQFPVKGRTSTPITLLSGTVSPFGQAPSSTTIQTAIFGVTRAIVWAGAAFVALVIIL